MKEDCSSLLSECYSRKYDLEESISSLSYLQSELDSLEKRIQYLERKKETVDELIFEENCKDFGIDMDSDKLSDIEISILCDPYHTFYDCFYNNQHFEGNLQFNFSI